MKSFILKIVIALIFLGAFNLIYFLGGIQHTEPNWWSYGFINFAFLCLVSTPLFCKGSSDPVLTGSVWLRAIFYFFTELTVGFVFLLVSPETIIWPLIVQSVILAVFLILQIMSVLANDVTTQSLEKQKSESFAKALLVGQLQSRYSSQANPQVKKSLANVIETLRACPIESFPETVEADLAVRNGVELLCQSLDSGDMNQASLNASKLLSAIQSRNLIINRCR